MAEYHKAYPIASLRDGMFALFTHLQHASNDVVTIVDDGTKAVWIDPTGLNAAASAWWNGITVLTANHFGDGSFIVFQVDFANPGGRQWQAKVLLTGTTTLSVEGSPNGGFSTGTSTFGANPVTGTLQAFNVVPGAGDEFYISVSDLDTYDGGLKKYGYLRLIHRDISAPTTSKAFYVGGYCPADVTNDTDPFVMLYGAPQLAAGTASTTWGYGGASVGAMGGRAPVEDGLAVTSLTASYAFISSYYPVTFSSHSQTRAGVEVEVQITIHQQVGHLLGYFGPYTMRAVASAVGSFQINNAATRLAINDIAHRWAP